jgi:hypothetical protein
MEDDRTEQAIRRIEAALGRIARAADTIAESTPAGGQRGRDHPQDTAGIDPVMPPSVSKLVVRHEALREEVANQVRRIDDLVARLEQ